VYRFYNGFTMSLKTFVPVLLLPLLGMSADLPTLRTEPIGGGSVFFVKNTASQPLTAFLIELVGYPGSSYSLWKDEIFDEPIAPGAEKRIQITNMTVGAVPDYVKLTAAIYADGSSAGAPAKVSQFMDRRRFLFLTTRELIRRLDKAQTKEAAIADLKGWSTTLQSAGKMNPNSQAIINQNAARELVNDTVAKLGTGSLEEARKRAHALDKALNASKPTI
jgi:hypothetical protein